MDNKKEEGCLQALLGFIAFIAFFAFVFFSIDYIISDKGGIYSFNPYVDPMIITIDGIKSITIYSNKLEKIKIKSGSHHITSTVGDFKLVDKDIYVESIHKSKGALLNLTKQPMYLWGVIYEEESSYEFNNISYNNINTVMINETQIIGDVKEYPASQIIIPKEWYYNINQAIPNRIQTTSKNFVQYRSKLFTRKDLLNYWQYQY